MERLLSQDERIRRAEEIYARRQDLRERTKRATLNVSNETRNFRLLKKLALQITICMLMYFIFYLINTTNYSFSETTLNKTENLISYDTDFASIYNTVIEAVRNYIFYNRAETKQNTETQEQNVESQENEENSNNQEQGTEEQKDEKQEENGEQNSSEEENQDETIQTNAEVSNAQGGEIRKRRG